MNSKLFDLGARVAIVTGASRGIGRAIALALAAEGARVVVASRSQEACQGVVDEIGAAGGEAEAMACNVSQESQVHGLVDATLERFGQLDVVVANAAANPLFGPMSQATEDALQKVLDTNLKSPLWLANRAFPHMAGRPGACMIVVSSITAYFGSRMLGVYALSKAADLQLVRNLAVEWGGQGIRVNGIAPGLIRTDFSKALWEDPRQAAGVAHITPLGRLGEPEDIAGVAVFLASDAARFMTGHTVVADGGITIRDLG